MSDRPGAVGPYRVVGTLGEGGMGVVHLALDPANRAVAVKVLKPQVAADADARRRLGREVATLRRVRHPHVAEVLDADLEASPPYVVTAFFPARNLDQAVRELGPMPVEYVAHLGRGLAGALQAIHAAGVVHRDVKPANVLLLDDTAILIDFGIAHVVDESRITSAGLVMGTPGYLPPELVEGNQITPATDWWGWGATLAHAATGRPPFGTGPAAVVLDRVRRGQADLAGVDPRLARVLNAALTVNPVYRGTGEMLLAGLAVIPAWHPGRVPLAPALRPEEMPTVAVDAGPPPAVVPAAVPPPPTAQRRSPPPGPGQQPGRDQVRTEALPGGRPPAPPAPPRDLMRTEALAAPVDRTRPMPSVPPAPERRGAAVPARSPGPPGHPTAPLPVTSAGPAAAAPAATAPGTAEVVDTPTPATGPGIGQRAVLVLLLAALVAAAVVAPGAVLVAVAAWLVVVRVVDRTVATTQRRRAERGPRVTDAGLALAALPWRLLVALVRGLTALVLPLLLAISGAFLAAAVLAPSSPDPHSVPALAAGAVVGWFGAWWGPGGAVLRRGTRMTVRAATRRRGPRAAVLALTGFVLAAAVLTAAGGVAPDWRPLPDLAGTLPSPDASGLRSWFWDLLIGDLPGWSAQGLPQGF